MFIKLYSFLSQLFPPKTLVWLYFLQLVTQIFPKPSISHSSILSLWMNLITFHHYKVANSVVHNELLVHLPYASTVTYSSNSSNCSVSTVFCWLAMPSYFLTTLAWVTHVHISLVYSTSFSLSNTAAQPQWIIGFPPMGFLPWVLIFLCAMFFCHWGLKAIVSFAEPLHPELRVALLCHSHVGKPPA